MDNYSIVVSVVNSDLENQSISSPNKKIRR